MAHGQRRQSTACSVVIAALHGWETGSLGLSILSSARTGTVGTQCCEPIGRRATAGSMGLGSLETPIPTDTWACYALHSAAD